jgi:hypothetical protein
MPPRRRFGAYSFNNASVVGVRRVGFGVSSRVSEIFFEAAETSLLRRVAVKWGAVPLLRYSRILTLARATERGAIQKQRTSAC